MALNQITIKEGQPIGRQTMGEAPAKLPMVVNHDTAQGLLLLLPFTWASLFLLTRPLGALGLVLALGPLVLVAVNGGRRYFSRPLIVFTIITAVYAFLSYLGFLDQRLTLLFSPNAVFQQCAYGLFLAFAVASFAFYHQGVAENRRWFLRVEEVVFFLAIASRLISIFVTDPDANADYIESTTGLSQFVNAETFLAFIFVRRLLQSPRPSQPLNIFIALGLLATAGSAQSRLTLLALLALTVAPSMKKPITVGFLVALLSIIAVAWPFANEVWAFDPNTGIRLFFWHDAVQRFLESYGVGVGFGTETIRPFYDVRITDVSLVPLDDPSFIQVGSHNSFVDALYRMGLLGFGCFAYYIFHLFRSVLRSASVNVFDCWTICLTMTVLLVNVGLVSFNFFFGSSFLLGWLTYRASRSQLPRGV